MSYNNSCAYLSTSNLSNFNSYHKSSNFSDIYRSYSNLKSLPPSTSALLNSTASSYFSSRSSPSSSPFAYSPKRLLTTSPKGTEIKLTTVNSGLASSTPADFKRSSTDRIIIETTPQTKSNYPSSSSTFSCSLGSSFDDSTTKVHVSTSSSPPGAQSCSSSSESLMKSRLNNNNTNNIEPTRKNENYNDLSASAISNIQLNLTDDLMTQVDYYLNEVDNRMICSGRQVEIESFELSAKSGLISKCIYLNQLLKDANMNETNLDSDPLFTQNGKTILIFNTKKEAEDFANKQTNKFNVTFTNSSSSNGNNDGLKQQQQQHKKNVSFVDNSNYSLNVSATTNDENETDEYNCGSTTSLNKKPILKNSSNNNLYQSSSPSYRVDSITGRTTIGFTNPTLSTSLSKDEQPNIENSNVVITANTNNSKKSKVDGYEILTIRAKLKQRVNQNRSKNVTLGDIDSIMRNVVTIIQDEFMKRFPSGPSSSVNGSSDSYLSRN